MITPASWPAIRIWPGTTYGYDGPCPPWNDERLHHYVFTVYALDTDRLEVTRRVQPATMSSRLSKAHILDQASLTGTYTLNPKVSE